VVTATAQVQVRGYAGTPVAGRYQLERVLGVGGFASVWQAQDLRMDRLVAIKLLRADASQLDGARERFLREAHDFSCLRHPDIVRAFDVGVTDEGQPFIAMELLEGHPLESELRERGRMAPDRAVRLMVRCLDALESAHACGVVHRDLKPSNLFLVSPGTRVESLAILDFGLAVLLEDPRARLTRSGVCVGTPEYLAPEYLRAKIVTPALDVYQMGLVLIEMLLGRPVVTEADPYQCALIHGMGQVAVPEALRGSPLAPVVACAISFDHRARYASAGPFRDALERAAREGLGALEVDGTPAPQLLVVAPSGRRVDAQADTRPDTPVPLAPESGVFVVAQGGEASALARRVRWRAAMGWALVGLAVLLTIAGGLLVVLTWQSGVGRSGDGRASAWREPAPRFGATQPSRAEALVPHETPASDAGSAGSSAPGPAATSSPGAPATPPPAATPRRERSASHPAALRGRPPPVVPASRDPNARSPVGSNEPPAGQRPLRFFD
jgi:serine/threonine-protein kinase